MVDNDRNILAALRISLAADGYRAVVSSSAIDAFRKLNRRRFELVIADIHLDGLVDSGLAFLTDLRYRVPHLPVIAISNSLDGETEKRLKDLGIRDFFSKPLELRSLKRALRSLLLWNREPSPRRKKPRIVEHLARS